MYCNIRRGNSFLNTCEVCNWNEKLIFTFDIQMAMHRNIISIVKSTRCTNVSNLFYFILFWNASLHVLDRLSIHHQAFKIVRTATGICHTDTAVCLLACLLLYAQS